MATAFARPDSADRIHPARRSGRRALAPLLAADGPLHRLHLGFRRIEILPARSASTGRAWTTRRCGRPTMPAFGPTCSYEKDLPVFAGIRSAAMTTPQPIHSFPPPRISRPAKIRLANFSNAALPVWRVRAHRRGLRLPRHRRGASGGGPFRWRAGATAGLVADRRHAARHQGHHRDRRHADRARLAAVCRLPHRRDAASVAALREAGAVILGKVVTTEFAATEPRGTATRGLERTPGGSSSGSAAAVACGMVPAALGTQVVGSILRPAAFAAASASSRVSAGSTAAAATIISARLHRRARRLARGCLAGRGQHRGPRRGDLGYPRLQGPPRRRRPSVLAPWPSC